MKIPVGLAFVCLYFPPFLSQRADFFFSFFPLKYGGFVSLVFHSGENPV